MDIYYVKKIIEYFFAKNKVIKRHWNIMINNCVEVDNIWNKKDIYIKDIYVSVILRFRKIVCHNRLINKSGSTKNQENSVHFFEYNYLTKSSRKILAR